MTRRHDPNAGDRPRDDDPATLRRLTATTPLRRIIALIPTRIDSTGRWGFG